MRNAGKVLLSGGVIFFLLCAVMSLAIAQTACVPPPSGLISWWPGEGNAHDIISGHDGTPYGGVTFGAGLVGQAFHFDGIDAYIDVGNDASFKSSTELTVAAWVKPDSNDFLDTHIFGFANKHRQFYFEHGWTLRGTDDFDRKVHIGLGCLKMPCRRHF